MSHDDNNGNGKFKDVYIYISEKQINEEKEL